MSPHPPEFLLYNKSGQKAKTTFACGSDSTDTATSAEIFKQSTGLGTE